ncbi:MAG: ATP-binding protein [Clostridia bacterium]
MLKYFAVKGFKGFEEKIELDFSNVRDYKFNTECIASNKVKNMILYGKNSTGKSNLGLAILDITAHLVDKNIGPKLYDYYLNTNSDKAEFKYIFDFDGDKIEYTYAKKDARELIFEKLLLNDELILHHNYVAQAGYYTGLKELAPTLNYSFFSDGSILRYALNNTALSKEHPLYKFVSYISKMLWFRTLDENRYIGYKKNSDDYITYIFEQETLSEFQLLLEKIGINEKLVVKEDTDGNKKLYFDNKKPLPFFNVASSGTKALYTFFYWYKTSFDATFMYIDEFDAYYHYELSEIIINLLKKMPTTQSIVTTHNTNLLTNRIMRPDCYFILSPEKLVNIADATRRELREGHNLEKLYMAGEFYGQ